MSTTIKTFNRGKLHRLVEAGRVVAVAGHHFDDMTGSDNWHGEKPVAMKPADWKDCKAGTVYLTPWHFQTKSGRAYTYEGSDPHVVTLIVHSNSSYTLRVIPVPEAGQDRQG